jgi:flagellar motor switch protein FliG
MSHFFFDTLRKEDDRITAIILTLLDPKDAAQLIEQFPVVKSINVCKLMTTLSPSERNWVYAVSRARNQTKKAVNKYLKSR